jgi:AcrR family transcriptional regulator
VSKPRPATPAPAAPRKRRAPEEARLLILRACQALLAKHGPDAVGLKDVASKAGVSHALVTHYFGTIDDLVNAAMEAYVDEQRTLLIESIASHPEGRPREWIRMYFDWIRKPATSRLFAWALVTGRIHRDDFFSRRGRGAERVADAIESRLRADGADVTRERIDLAIVLFLSASHGYALGKSAYWAGLGVDAPGAQADERFIEMLADAIEGFVRAP